MADIETQQDRQLDRQTESQTDMATEYKHAERKVSSDFMLWTHDIFMGNFNDIMILY